MDAYESCKEKRARSQRLRRSWQTPEQKEEQRRQQREYARKKRAKMKQGALEERRRRNREYVREKRAKLKELPEEELALLRENARIDKRLYHYVKETPEQKKARLERQKKVMRLKRLKEREQKEKQKGKLHADQEQISNDTSKDLCATTQKEEEISSENPKATSDLEKTVNNTSPSPETIKIEHEDSDSASESDEDLDQAIAEWTLRRAEDELEDENTSGSTPKNKRSNPSEYNRYEKYIPKKLPPPPNETKEERMYRLKKEISQKKSALKKIILEKYGNEGLTLYEEGNRRIIIPGDRAPMIPRKLKIFGPLTLEETIRQSEENYFKYAKYRKNLPQEELQARKKKYAEKSRNKIQMDRGENKIVEILTSINPLEILEDSNLLECAEWWTKYKSIRIPPEVKEWRKKLYPLLIQKAPENETEVGKYSRYDEILSTINNCLKSYGNVVKEHVKWNNEKIMFYLNKVYHEKDKGLTEEEKKDRREKANAYQREAYQRKKMGLKGGGGGEGRKRGPKPGGRKKKYLLSLGDKSASSATTSLTHGGVGGISENVSESAEGSEVTTSSSSSTVNLPIVSQPSCNSSGGGYYNDDDSGPEGHDDWTPIGTFEIDAMLQNAVLHHPEMPIAMIPLTTTTSRRMNQGYTVINPGTQQYENTNEPSAFHNVPPGSSSFYTQDESSQPLEECAQVWNPNCPPPPLESELPINYSLQLVAHLPPSSVVITHQIENSSSAALQENSVQISTSTGTCSSAHRDHPIPSKKAKISMRKIPINSEVNEEQGESLLILKPDSNQGKQSQNEPSKCATCSKIFPTELECDNHIKRFHQKPKPFVCKLCFRAFERTKELIHHIWYGHYEGGERILCPYCNKTFRIDAKKHLGRHIQNYHSDKVAEEERNESNRRRRKNEPSMKLLKCFYCPVTFATSEIELEDHIKVTHSDKIPSMYFCKFCGIMLTMKNHVEEHLPLFHPKERFLVNFEDCFVQNEMEKEKVFLCESCDSKFLTLEFLTQHAERSHAETFCGNERNEEKYSCRLCNKTFKCEKVRDNHILIDCPLKKLKCVQCGEEPFGSEGLLLDHVRREHSGGNKISSERAIYKCELCRSSYTSVLSLLSHLSRSHWDDLPKISEREALEGPNPSSRLEISPTDGNTIPSTHQLELLCINVTSKTKTQDEEGDDLSPSGSIHIHQCTICKSNFSAETFHKVHKKYGKMNRRVCIICNREFARSSFLERHKAKMHYVPCGENVQSGLQESGSATLKCTICTEVVSLSTEEFHKEHEAVGIYNDPDIKLCPFCTKAIFGTESMKRHIRMCHSLQESCESLATPAPFSAVVPPEASTEDGLIRIIVYPCSVCQTKYSTEEFLKEHISLKHPGEREVVVSLPRELCEICNKTFADVEGLLCHRKEIHQRDKKKMYECPQCAKRFSGTKQVRTHVKRVHITNNSQSIPQDAYAVEDAFKCGICLKVFPSEERLEAHKAHGHLALPHQFNTFCQFCGKQVRPEFVRRHVRHFHPEHAGVKEKLLGSKTISLNEVLKLIEELRSRPDFLKDLEKKIVLKKKIKKNSKKSKCKKKATSKSNENCVDLSSHDSVEYLEEIEKPQPGKKANNLKELIIIKRDGKRNCKSIKNKKFRRVLTSEKNDKSSEKNLSKLRQVSSFICEFEKSGQKPAVVLLERCDNLVESLRLAKNAAVKEKNIVRDESEDAAVKEKDIVRDESEDAAVKEKDIVSDESEDAAVKEKNIVRDESEDAGVKEKNIVSDESEDAAVKEKDIVSDESEDAAVKEKDIVSDESEDAARKTIKKSCARDEKRVCANKPDDDSININININVEDSSDLVRSSGGDFNLDSEMMELPQSDLELADEAHYVILPIGDFEEEEEVYTTEDSLSAQDVEVETTLDKEISEDKISKNVFE